VPESIWPTIHAERQALANDLADLNPEQWSTPTMCSEWDVGIKRDYPLDGVTQALAFYAKSNTIIGGRDRIAGLTMQATDTDFSVGAGPLVEGPAISLLLAASGRKAALDDLSGPGVEVLRRR
jgi:hypothetical protein